MTERYDDVAAAHYAAYRPPLHREVLRRVLPDDATFEVGLDVGSGTGRSAVALAERCRRVYGVEPSRAMLERAEPADRVTYLHGSADAIPLPGGSADVVTLAGVLVYADTGAARAEVHRVGRPGGLVVVYDFEVLVGRWLERLGATPPEAGSAYDHGADLSGTAGFAERAVLRERVALPVAPEELAHVLLSDSGHLDRLAGALGTADPFEPVVDALRAGGAALVVDVDLYASVYALV